MATERTSLSQHRTELARLRNELAEVRTHWANTRTRLSLQRTHLARGRTSLALVRTGLAILVFGLALLRYFDFSLWSIFDAGLAVAGVGLVVRGMKGYLASSRLDKRCQEALVSDAVVKEFI